MFIKERMINLRTLVLICVHFESVVSPLTRSNSNVGSSGGSPRRLRDYIFRVYDDDPCRRLGDIQQPSLEVKEAATDRCKESAMAFHELRTMHPDEHAKGIWNECPYIKPSTAQCAKKRGRIQCVVTAEVKVFCMSWSTTKTMKQCASPLAQWRDVMSGLQPGRDFGDRLGKRGSGKLGAAADESSRLKRRRSFKNPNDPVELESEIAAMNIGRT